MNNINSINKKERDSKEINIILGKLAGDGYCYLEDTIHERSKIKIPLNYDQCSDYKNFMIEEFSQISEKSVSDSQKYSNSNISCSNVQKINFEDSKIIEKEKKNFFEDNSDIPLLKGISMMNSQNGYLTPSSSSWFKYDDIHEMEVKGNPEFFSGKYPSKTPEVYKEYRNYIINLYREHPDSYLSSTSKLIYQ
jgi:hypothetical protein